MQGELGMLLNKSLDFTSSNVVDLAAFAEFTVYLFEYQSMIILLRFIVDE